MNSTHASQFFLDLIFDGFHVQIFGKVISLKFSCFPVHRGGGDIFPRQSVGTAAVPFRHSLFRAVGTYDSKFPWQTLFRGGGVTAGPFGPAREGIVDPRR